MVSDLCIRPAVLEMLELVIEEMDKNEIPINIYLDLSKAFDTLDHEVLLYKLQYYGLKQTALKLLNNYLTNRTQYVVVDDVMSAKLPLKVGVPQGSILGPMLFIQFFMLTMQLSLHH